MPAQYETRKAVGRCKSETRKTEQNSTGCVASLLVRGNMHPTAYIMPFSRSGPLVIAGARSNIRTDNIIFDNCRPLGHIICTSACSCASSGSINVPFLRRTVTPRRSMPLYKSTTWFSGLEMFHHSLSSDPLMRTTPADHCTCSIVLQDLAVLFPSLSIILPCVDSS